MNSNTGIGRWGRTRIQHENEYPGVNSSRTNKMSHRSTVKTLSILQIVTGLKQTMVSTKAADLTRFSLKVGSTGYGLLINLLSTQALNTWQLSSPKPKGSSPDQTAAYFQIQTWSAVFLFKQKLLLLHWEIKGVRAPSDRKKKSSSNRGIKSNFAKLSSNSDSTRPGLPPILTVHFLPTRTECRSAGPCLEQSSQPLPDVILFPRNVPEQKGWWRVLQKSNSTKKKKHHQKRWPHISDIPGRM